MYGRRVLQRQTIGGELPTDPRQWITRNTTPFREAPLTHEIAATSQFLRLAQDDPADRFLAATALVLDLTLVTADASLLGLGEIATLGNR
jgi:PIN domain nuclease of toxin-antitoxin system